MGLSSSIIQIIVLSIDTDIGSLFIRISRCVPWKRMTSRCPKNQLAQMKSWTLLLFSCGDDGREGTTFAYHACLAGICNLIRHFSQNWDFYFVFPSYSVHIRTSFLTGRITIPWLFLGSELTKKEISWILEQKKLFNQVSWQGIFAPDFMSKEWISTLTLSPFPSTYLKSIIWNANYNITNTETC